MSQPAVERRSTPRPRPAAPPGAAGWREELEGIESKFSHLRAEWRAADASSACPRRQAEACLDRAATSDDPAIVEALAARALAIAPNSGRAWLAAGLLRIGRGDGEGVRDLVRSVELDPRRSHQAFAAIGAFLRQNPSWPGGVEAREAIAALSDKAGLWTAERDAGPRALEPFAPCGFAPAEEAEIHAALAENPNIVSAILVRRETSEWTHVPAFLATIRLDDGERGGSPAMEEAASVRLARTLDVIAVYGSVRAIYPAGHVERFIAWRMNRASGAFRFFRH